MTPPGMGEILKQAHDFQEKLGRAQEELRKIRVEGTAGGGMVTVAANGKKEILEVRLNRDALDPNDIELIEDLIVAAANQALSNAEEAARTEMNKATGGVLGGLTNVFKIPGM